MGCGADAEAHDCRVVVVSESEQAEKHDRPEVGCRADAETHDRWVVVVRE